MPTTALATALDSIPLVPEASCDLAVELAIRSLGDDRPEAGLRLIAPIYSAHGSVAAATDRPLAAPTIR